MSQLLRKGERCPLHHSFFCCGRTPDLRSRKREYSAPGVRRVEDVFHPRGYREICSAAELRRRKHLLMAKGNTICFYCAGDLLKSQYGEIELAHKEPKGMGGARHDDHITNLALAHRLCNRTNGSKRPAA